MTTKQNRLIVDDEPMPAAIPAAPSNAPGSVAAAQPTRRRRRAKPSMTGDYPGMRRVTGYVEPTLFRWLKSISAETDKPMIEIFEEALTAYVESYAAGRKFGG
ncbi:MAG: hypothetical protein ACOYM8_11040 [Caulobacterales bacterium]